MTAKLDNANEAVAKQIYTTFQRSYKIEAELIGAQNFPPLSRTDTDIQNSQTLFYGLYVSESLAGVIELETNNSQLEINSLTVDPEYFRQGIANRLMHFVLNDFASTAPVNLSTIVVETAVVNEPAIKLYKKHGFVEFKRWTPEHGIEKLAMIKSRAV
ncbi:MULTISPECIES: GNAT family N-acetyltransferase [Pseudoalteromonas]|uniref:GNAT family N-acetyltransferase n=1 Tax=Pseudoalteromonas issachenkonii TaxID=152297 RepID=A0ABU9H0L9_9GAMM|nr:GNAT family N-acetyltransferase [Pseudoalteromonas sp. SR44-2]MBB1336840.1 GNAT family N-acetyltransferase [Pseudoalteromonas sp. SR44-2]